ncbi:hypothetical protein [Streptomyces specialis]|uniref:hypothetical protein n=1 Tax=Streptomyces specialis TaxID=498367 RepID=UPI00073E3C4A|nr:hypothetical protein [Streptomyces specialis]
MITRKAVIGMLAPCAIALGFAAGTVSLAAPAHATANECLAYLMVQGYDDPDTALQKTCRGTADGHISHANCVDRLHKSYGVREGDATVACALAVR